MLTHFSLFTGIGGIYKRKQMNLGRFKTAKEAAKAYNEAAIKLHGDYSCLNQI